MSVMRKLNNLHYTSNLLLTSQSCNLRLPRNSPNCTFRKRHNQPDVISNLRQAQLISFLDVFHNASMHASNPGQEFVFLIMGILFETNPWAKHTLDTMARRKYDSRMNIARVMIDNPTANESREILEADARVGCSMYKAHDE
jgi:hypothetical protein